MADGIAPICCNLSVREDENGPFILAFGVKDTHSLELRKVGKKWILELWHGKTADVEKVVGELSFSKIEDAHSKAEEWLQKDTI